MISHIFYWNAFCVEVGKEPELWFCFHPNASAIFTLDKVNTIFVCQSILSVTGKERVFRASLFDDEANSLWVGFRKSKSKSKYARVSVYYFGIGNSSDVVEAFMRADDVHEKWKGSFEFEELLSTDEGRKRIDEIDAQKYSSILHRGPLMLPERSTRKMAQTILDYLNGKNQKLPVKESEWS